MMKTWLRKLKRTLPVLLLVMTLTLAFLPARQLAALEVDLFEGDLSGQDLVIGWNLDIPDVPSETMAVLNSLTLKLRTLSDLRELENPKVFADLALWRGESETLSLKFLFDDSPYVQIPQLLEGVYKFDLGTLMSAAMEEQGISLDVFDSLSSLDSIDPEALLDSLLDAFMAAADELPDESDLSTQTFTIGELTEDYQVHSVALQGEELLNVILALFDRLAVDANFEALFMNLVVPLMVQDEGMPADLSYQEYMSQIREGMVSQGIDDDTVLYLLLATDEAGENQGYGLAMLDLSEQDPQQLALSLIHIEGELEQGILLRIENNAMDQVFDFEVHYVENETGLSGTLDIKSEEYGSTENILNGTFTNVRQVPFDDSVTLVGSLALNIMPDQEYQSVLIQIDVNVVDDLLETMVNLPIGQVYFQTKHLDPATIEMPDPATLNPIEIKNLEDIETLMSPEVMQKLMTILSDLGLADLMDEME